MKFLILLLSILTFSVEAKKFEANTVKLGEPNTSSSTRIEVLDGGYLRKAFSGLWFLSEDGISESRIATGSIESQIGSSLNDFGPHLATTTVSATGTHVGRALGFDFREGPEVSIAGATVTLDYAPMKAEILSLAPQPDGTGAATSTSAASGTFVGRFTGLNFTDGFVISHAGGSGGTTTVSGLDFHNRLAVLEAAGGGGGGNVFNDNALGDDVAAEGCLVVNNGSASLGSASGLCTNWISSVSRTAAGQVTVNVNAASINNFAVCTISPAVVGSTRDATVAVNTPTQILTFMFNSTAGNPVDNDFYIICLGKRP